MPNKYLVGIMVFIAALLSALSYVTARFVDQKEITRAKTEMIELRASRDSIRAVVAIKDSLQRTLQARVTDLQTQANYLRASVDSLEEVRQEQQLSVRQLRKKEDLQRRLKETFPEMAYSDWGVTEVVNEDVGIGVEYLLVPLWFSETFIIDHQNAVNYKEQRDRLQMVDSLQMTVSSLKDSVLVLEQQKTMAYRQGYDEAYTKYEELNQRYIMLLQKPPQVKVGIPAYGTILGAAAAGVGLGVTIK